MSAGPICPRPESPPDLYNSILGDKPRRILELGMAHASATCYKAAALAKIGGGVIIISRTVVLT
jgi:hypothetical protein